MSEVPLYKSYKLNLNLEQNARQNQAVSHSCRSKAKKHRAVVGESRGWEIDQG